MNPVKLFALAHRLADLEPKPMESDPNLAHWHEWRTLCEVAARFIAAGDDRIHEEFMDACGL